MSCSGRQAQLLRVSARSCSSASPRPAATGPGRSSAVARSPRGFAGARERPGSPSPRRCGARTAPVCRRCDSDRTLRRHPCQILAGMHPTTPQAPGQAGLDPNWPPGWPIRPVAAAHEAATPTAATPAGQLWRSRRCWFVLASSPWCPLATSPPLPGTAQPSPVTPRNGLLGTIAWPASGVSAAGISGIGVLPGPGASQPVPIASVAKVMTAYIILRDHPLGVGEPGPPIVVQPGEAAAYPAQARNGDSLVPVTAGNSSPNGRPWKHCCCHQRTTWRGSSPAGTPAARRRSPPR